MSYCDPHSPTPVDVLDVAEQVVAFVGSWSQALADGSVGSGNPDEKALEGVATVAAWVAYLLAESRQHVMRECDCFGKEGEAE